MTKTLLLIVAAVILAVIIGQAIATEIQKVQVASCDSFWGSHQFSREKTAPPDRSITSGCEERVASSEWFTRLEVFFLTLFLCFVIGVVIYSVGGLSPQRHQ